MRFPWRGDPEDRERRRLDRALAMGFRGTFTQPEAGLPEGFDPPSAALVPARLPDSTTDAVAGQ